MAVCPLRLQLILAALLLSPVVAQWPSAPSTVRLTKGNIREIGLSPGDGVLRITTNAGIWLHDPETLALRQLLAGSVEFTRFSDDGRLLAAALRDTSIVVWELASGAVLARLRGFGNRVTAIAFDGDAERLAAGSRDGEMLVWDLDAQELLAQMRAEEVRALVFDHPENRLISANGFRAVRVWDLDSSRLAPRPASETAWLCTRSPASRRH